MANFISTIRIQTVAIWGIFCAPSPLFALPLAAQDDVGAPSNSTPEAQIPPSPTPSLRQMAHEETTNAIKQTAPETPAKSPKAKHSAGASTPHPSSERFVYRDKLAIADLKRLQNFDGWFLKAAWAVVNKVHWRKQSLLSYTFHDVNDDGAYEAIVLAQTERRGTLRQSLAIYSFDDDLAPILRFEHHQNIASTVANYTRTVGDSPANRGFAFCEDWRIASWQFHECHDLFFDAQWRARVQAYEITTREPQAHAAQYNRFDFEQMTATRTYSHLPDGSFLPARAQSADYEMVFAPYDETKSIALSPNRSAKYGTKSTPLSYAVSWNDDALNIAIDAHDDDVFGSINGIQNNIQSNHQGVKQYSKPTLRAMIDDMAHDVARSQSPMCRETMALQTIDHVEVWLDLAPALQIDRNAPQTWQAEYEKSYNQSPYRHEIDADVYAFAITANGCIVPIHPMRDYWRGLPIAHVKPTPSGYVVDVQIPASFLGAQSMQKIAGPQGIGMSLIQHDIHENGDFESSKTSQWQWADPFTFGQLWLLRTTSTKSPTFPFEWNKFLNWQ